MVKDVEELGSETKSQSLGEVKLPLHCKIGLPSSETPQDIAAEIALLSFRWWSKSRFIEYLAARIATRTVQEASPAPRPGLPSGLINFLSPVFSI